MRKELKDRILAYNRNVTAKARDMEVLAAELAKLPPGQLKKVLTAEVTEILERYGVIL